MAPHINPRRDHRMIKLLSALAVLVLGSLACESDLSRDDFVAQWFRLFGNPEQNPPDCGEQYIDVEIQAPRTTYSPGDAPIELDAQVDLSNIAYCEVLPEDVAYYWRAAGEDEILSEENPYYVAPDETTTYSVEVDPFPYGRDWQGRDLITIQVGVSALEGGGDDKGELEQAEAEELEVNQPVTVTLTAAPAVLTLGDVTYLLVQVSGGQSPYTYAWSHDPTQSLGAFYDSPIETTIYEVTVTDAAGTQATDTATVVVQEILPEFTYSTHFCGPDPNGLTVAFESDMPLLQFIERYTGLRITSSSGVTTFECLPDVNQPTNLYCVGPGAAGGGLRTLDLMDSVAGEPAFTTDQTLSQCPPPATATPEGGGSGGDCYYDEDSHEYVCP